MSKGAGIKKARYQEEQIDASLKKTTLLGNAAAGYRKYGITK